MSQVKIQSQKRAAHSKEVRERRYLQHLAKQAKAQQRKAAHKMALLKKQQQQLERHRQAQNKRIRAHNNSSSPRGCSHTGYSNIPPPYAIQGGADLLRIPPAFPCRSGTS